MKRLLILMLLILGVVLWCHDVVLWCHGVVLWYRIVHWYHGITVSIYITLPLHYHTISDNHPSRRMTTSRVNEAVESKNCRLSDWLRTNIYLQKHNYLVLYWSKKPKKKPERKPDFQSETEFQVQLVCRPWFLKCSCLSSQGQSGLIENRCLWSMNQTTLWSPL